METQKISMLLYLTFFFYFLIFQLAIFLLGLNTTRIRITYLIHPRTVCYILPVIIHYLISNLLFRSINPLISVLLPSLFGYMIALKMQKIRIIGNTGSIATGKSTLTNLIKNNYKDIDIIDCDQISRNIRKKDQQGYKLLMKLLGNHAQQYINPITKQIDQQGRKKLNQYVFNNKQFRDKLTKQMGMLIMKRIFIRIFKNIITGKNVMLIDAPLLYESKILEYVCYPVVLVGCCEETQIKRLVSRDHYSQQQAKKRIMSQMPLLQKIKKAQIYLSNQTSQADLIRSFQEHIKKYLSKQVPHSRIPIGKDKNSKKKQMKNQDEECEELQKNQNQN